MSDILVSQFATLSLITIAHLFSSTWTVKATAKQANGSIYPKIHR